MMMMNGSIKKEKILITILEPVTRKMTVPVGYDFLISFM